MRPVCIYGLEDPYTGHIRYIGKTCDPEARLVRHWDSRNILSTPCAAWLRSLRVAPKIVVLDQVAYDEWKEVEKLWIAYYRQLRPDLLNILPLVDAVGDQQELTARLKGFRRIYCQCAFDLVFDWSEDDQMYRSRPFGR